MTGPEGLHDRGAAITEPVGRRTYHGAVLRRRDGCRVRRTAEVDGGLGCCMIYRREAALEAGGYDPGFNPVWFDDLDLTLSLRRLGLKVFCLPEVEVVHHVGERIGRRDSALRRRPARAAGRAAKAPLAGRSPTPATGAPGPPLRLLAGEVGLRPAQPGPGRELQRRWGDTEVCWRYDPERRRARARRSSRRWADRRRPGHLHRRGRPAAPRAAHRARAGGRRGGGDRQRLERLHRGGGRGAGRADRAPGRAPLVAAGGERGAAQRGRRPGAVHAARLLPGAGLRGRRAQAPGRAGRRLGGAQAGAHPRARARAAAGRHRRRRHVARPPAQERAGGPRAARAGLQPPRRGLRRRRRGGPVPPRGPGGRRDRRARWWTSSCRRGARTPTWPGGCGCWAGAASTSRPPPPFTCAPSAPRPAAGCRTGTGWCSSATGC